MGLDLSLKKLEVNIISRRRDILPRVVRTYGFSYDFNAKPLILKANPLSNYKGNLGKIAIGTTIDEISPLLEMILTSSFFLMKGLDPIPNSCKNERSTSNLQKMGRV